MTDGDLSIDELRALWRAVRAPGDSGAPAAAECEAVSWMREAWAGVEAPPLSIAVKRAARKRKAAPDWSVFALAAAALVIAGAALFAPLRERVETEHATASGAGPNDGSVSEGGTPSEATEQPGEVVSPGMTVGSSSIVACDPDRIEMRQGSVRLILLRQGEATDGPTNGEPR